MHASRTFALLARIVHVMLTCACVLAQWAEGDELLINTEERSACALNGLLALSFKGDESPEDIYRMLGSVLLKSPVFNSQTIYSVIMVPSERLCVKIA